MQKFQINLGKTLPAFRGEWNENTQYDYNDIVTRYESSYVYQKKGASAGKDPYKTPTYEDEHGDEKLYWGLLAGRGVKGAKWYVGSGGKIERVIMTDDPGQQLEEQVVYYTITDIDQCSGAEVSEIAQIGDYYLDVLHGDIYMCVYPGGADKEGNIGNEAAIWRYSSAFSWLETYKYFFINTSDRSRPTQENPDIIITKYYQYSGNTQSGDQLEIVDLTNKGLIDISNSRFNCYLYGKSGESQEEIKPIEPIDSYCNVSWNNIREIEFEEKTIKLIEDEYLQDIWILVEQFSISQTTSSFTFNNMRVAAESVNWTQDASVDTGYVIEGGTRHPLMTFNIPRGRPLTIKKIYDSEPPTQTEDRFDKYDIVLGKITEGNSVVYHFYYNNNDLGIEQQPVWVDMGIFDYAYQKRYDEIILEVADWKQYIDANFPFYCDLALTGLQKEMIPYVILDGETATKSYISPTAEILEDQQEGVVLRLYAAKNPNRAITLKTVVCTLPPYVEES